MSRVGWTWGRGRGTNHLMCVNCRSTHNNAKTDWINSAHKQRHTPPPQRMAVCYRGGVCSLLAWEGSAPSPPPTQLHAGYCTPQLPISTPTSIQVTRSTNDFMALSFKAFPIQPTYTANHPCPLCSPFHSLHHCLPLVRRSWFSGSYALQQPPQFQPPPLQQVDKLQLMLQQQWVAQGVLEQSQYLK